MVKITGAGAAALRIKSMSGPEMARQLGAALYAAGDLIAAEEARLITTGAVSGKGHVPSRPGEPPSADTHQLDRSIETVQVSPLRVEVQTSAPHAIPLEFGTSRMAARPFAAPATANKRQAVMDLITRAVSKIAAGGKVVP